MASFYLYHWHEDERYREFLASAIRREYFKGCNGTQDVHTRILRLKKFYWKKVLGHEEASAARLPASQSPPAFARTLAHEAKVIEKILEHEHTERVGAAGSHESDGLRPGRRVKNVLYGLLDTPDGAAPLLPIPVLALSSQSLS
eukprot:TRINITY_DN2678_c0_g1_i2.p1 TRINITY_DN2678_c0_g1~~TRINITY_DN2678_c0_g1_i2.p1  ORF type:complete len:144 (-),score=36.26 TRINITY_DN2678_c0_g1_i2:213-644(-)